MSFKTISTICAAAIASLATCAPVAAQKTLTKGATLPDGAVDAGPGCNALCPGDINQTGVTNIDDLLSVINGWGPCAAPFPPYCPADINHNCVVNIDDLLGVINGWGPCPAPVNDNCANATTINLPIFGNFTANFCTITATTDGPP